MTRTIWFQLARGRAIVRNRAMKRARYLRSLIDRVSSGAIPAYVADHALNPGTAGLGLSEENRKKLVLDLLRMQMTWVVASARRANRSWRDYRRRHLEAQED